LGAVEKKFVKGRKQDPELVHEETPRKAQKAVGNGAHNYGNTEPQLTMRPKTSQVEKKLKKKRWEGLERVVWGQNWRVFRGYVVSGGRRLIGRESILGGTGRKWKLD